MGRCRDRLLLAGATALASFTPATAQEPTIARPPVTTIPPAPSSDADIIVTARKRQESLLKVPIVENVVPAQRLERLQTTDLKAVATLVPGLVLGNQLLSIGTQVSLRGVGTSSSDPGVDQSVSLNIDGLQLAQGLAYQSGLFDVQQVEVLKGPQALFYGKSSPGGVISLRTADPGSRFEVIGRLANDFEADERRGELIVSGPLTDTLGARVAGVYDATRGYFRNEAMGLAGTGARDPRYGHGPRSRSYQVRGTLLWKPDPAFSARLKVNLVRDRVQNADALQLTSCPDGTGAPFGIPFIGSGEDCRLDRTLRVVDMDPAAFPGIPNGGTPYLRNKQNYGTLELTYEPIRNLSLTSVTGYYGLRSRSLVNTYETSSAGPALAVDNRFHRRDVTQEIRLNSDFASPVNFTAGGFFQDAHFSNRITVRGNQAYPFGLPVIVQEGEPSIRARTYSLFGQVRWKIVPKLELAGGARWSDETRRENVYDFVLNRPVSPLVPRIHSDNWSPEATLTYQANDGLTVFGSYKKAYKSGSFSIATPSLDGANNAFGDEKAEGGEVGLKTRLLDRRLTVNLAGYRYDYTGLQVGAIEPTTTPVVAIRTVNAGAARVYGIDLDGAYRPSFDDGLTLRAAVNWNHARFLQLDNVPCYGGQTIAAGCVQQLNPATGLYTAQNLRGQRLVRAPDWQINFGFDYQLPIGRGMALVVSSNSQYSSRYLTALTNRPDVYQRAFFKTDASLTLQGPANRWELAVIGRNLTDKVTSSACVTFNGQNSGVLGGQITGGTGRGPAGIDEVGCFADRGREIWLRLTVRPFSREAN